MYAQTAVDGAIGGTVLDANGAVVSGATIVAHNNGTNAEQTVAADGSGYFRVTHLQPGTYNVVITAPGFGALNSKDVTVNVGSLTDLEARLTVGKDAQTVEVSGEAPAVNTTSIELSNVVGQHLLEDLPVSNYRWSNFALLTPGVVESGGYGLLSFRGQSTLFNNVTVDGADDNQGFFSEERGRTNIGYSTPKAAIQEFQVNTSNSSAEYGRAVGGIVNAVTKSGTNTFHGEGYFLDRDSLLAAYNDYTAEAVQRTPGGPFVNEPFKPTDIRKQYGFGIGGPIVRDKVFFFLAADRFYHYFPYVGVAITPSAFFCHSIDHSRGLAQLPRRREQPNYKLERFQLYRRQCRVHASSQSWPGDVLSSSIAVYKRSRRRECRFRAGSSECKSDAFPSQNRLANQ